MMGFLLLLLHIINGLGIITLIGYKNKWTVQLLLSIIIGIVIVSIYPFLLQLMYVPLTGFNVWIFTIVATLLINIKTIKLLIQRKWTQIIEIPKWSDLIIHIYELPFILFLVRCYAISFIRSYLLPTYVRDALSGPETIAEYALKERTFINSVFSIDLFSTNNQFKSPFLTDLQFLYKLAGYTNGGMWLGFLSIAFVILLYIWLRKLVHPFLAGFLVVAMTVLPEMFAYTFMPLYDYPNMVYWFLGTYFLWEFVTDSKRAANRATFWLMACCYASAVFIRSETLILLCMMIPMLFLPKWLSVKQKFINIFILLFLSFLAYFIPVEIYNNHYLPSNYEIDNLINKNLTNLQPLWERFSQIFNTLLVGEEAEVYWLYFFNWFSLIIGIDIIICAYYFKRKIINYMYWLYSMLVILIGLPIMGFLMPLMNVEHSTKRSMFKIFPIILVLVAIGPVFQWITSQLNKLKEKKIENI